MNNYVITGSLGHISKPIVEGLIRSGKTVSVLTTDPKKQDLISALGATARIGSLFESDFVKDAFAGADVVYTMIPPIFSTSNWRLSQNEIATNYVQAIGVNKIKHVVNLSSMGAHLGEGVGPVNAIHDFEVALNEIPGLNVKHLRPAWFYYNFNNLVGMAKQAGILGSNFGGGDRKIAMVHTTDIADAALEELLSLKFTGTSVRYVASDERTGSEIAEVLGNAIGKKLSWVEFSDEEQANGLRSAGVPETHVDGYVEMGRALRTGRMQEDFAKNKPELSSTRLESFAPEFAKAYNA